MLADGRYEYRAELIRVIDGDTVIVHVQLGFGISVIHTLRLHKINAMEIRGENREQGLEATEHLKKLINNHLPLTIKTIKDSTGKYGRYLAILYDKNGCNLNLQMVNDGHAVSVDY
jgi:micrococcal nuclease